MPKCGELLLVIIPDSYGYYRLEERCIDVYNMNNFFIFI